MRCFNSRPAPPAPTPGTYSLDPQISSSWVYVKIVEHHTSQIFYAYNLHTQKSFRFPDLPKDLFNSATAVLNRQLYVIGGSYFDGKHSKKMYKCDPVVFKWVKLPSVQTPRQNAVAAAANGMIYVFGGCRLRPQANKPWAEVYNPSTFQWTAIQNPPSDLSFSLSRQLLHAVVFRERIFVRNDCSGIAYNVTFGRWERIAAAISNFWFKWSSAVEVAGMLVAYYRYPNGAVTLRAYDPGQSLWLPLQFLNTGIIPMSVDMFQYLSVNGNLVAYHMGKSPTSIRFTMMQLQMNSTRKRLRLEMVNALDYPPHFRDWDLTGHAHAANP